MKLIPFSGQYLRLHEQLPFGIRDDAGRLLLAAGRLVESSEMLAELRGQSLFCDESESAEWHRRLAAVMDQMLRQGVALKEVAGARPDALTRETKVAQELSLTETWQELVMHLDQALRDIRPDGDWLQRVLGVHARVRQLAQTRLDASLYHLVYAAGHSTEKYSCHHSLLSLLISEQAAAMLGWPAPWLDSLGRAALTMNVAMVKLQDQLAMTLHPPSPDVRAEINAHAATGARMLKRAGLADELACSVVALHHDGSQAELPLADLPPERQLARLLRRVDIFTAKISRRASRQPMSPVQAAREACMGPAGVPDEIGGALLKAVGLYPPGSFVELACGEIGIVVARGRRANLPYVASLISAAGNVLGEPALRDSIESRFAVKGAVPPSQVKVRPPHERLWAMRHGQQAPILTSKV